MTLREEVVQGGRYYVGYVTTNDQSTIAYKCYIPDKGKVAKVDEMSRYFFFNTLHSIDIKYIDLASESCLRFVTDDNVIDDVFIIQNFVFVKGYTNGGKLYKENDAC